MNIQLDKRSPEERFESAVAIRMSVVRLERIAKLAKKRDRVLNALKNFPYTNKAHILEDASVLEEVEKDIEIQRAYLMLELE